MTTLPTLITIGKVIYQVEQPEAMRNPCSRGDIDYTNAAIRVAKRNKIMRKTYTPKERREVFWHEVTHAVLNEMDSELTYNEHFVTRFAKILSDAIDSATFD